MRSRRVGWACVAAVTLGLAGCDLIGPDQPPSAVELEIVEASSTFVALRWSAAESPVQYEVERDGAEVHTTEAVEYTDSNLEPEKVYVYRVRAVDGQGRVGEWSNTVTSQTEAAPTAVTVRVETTTSTSAVLAWEPAQSPVGIQHYEVQRDGTHIESTEELRFTDDTLDPETEYDYRVRAVDLAGSFGAWSEPVSAMTLDCPYVPAGMAVYFPIVQGRAWSFSYHRKQSKWITAGPNYQEWIGQLDWRIQSVTCSSTDIHFVLSAEFDGKLVRTWIAANSGDTLRVEEEPATWTLTDEAMVRSHFLHIPEYVHLPEHNATLTASKRRVELQWLYAEPSPATIDAHKGQPLGAVGSLVVNTATLVRGTGLTRWHFGVRWGGGGDREEVTIRLLE